MVATGFRSASAWTRIPKPRPGLKPSQGSIRITSRRCCHALRCWWTRRCVRIGHACWSGRDRRRELPNGLLYVMDVGRTKIRLHKDVIACRHKRKPKWHLHAQCRERGLACWR